MPAFASGKESAPEPLGPRRRGERERGGLSSGEVGPTDAGVDENAFDEDERGLVAPSGAPSRLWRILDRHPKIVDALRQA